MTSETPERKPGDSPAPAPDVSAARSGRRAWSTAAAVLAPLISVLLGYSATEADLHPDDWRVAAWGRVIGCFVVPYAIFRFAFAKARGGSGGAGPGVGCMTLLCLLPAWLALPAAADLWGGPMTEIVDVREIRLHREKTGPKGRTLAYSRAAHTRIAQLSDGREFRLPDRVELHPGRRKIRFVRYLKVVLSAES